MPNTWLEGYAWGTALLKYHLEVDGWARTKGWLKRAVSNALPCGVHEDFSAGWMDAILDSVN